MTDSNLEDARIELTADEKAALERLSDDEDDDVAIRADVIQALAMGRSTDQVVWEIGMDVEMVLFWKARFLEWGVEALFRKDPQTLTERRV